MQYLTEDEMKTLIVSLLALANLVDEAAESKGTEDYMGLKAGEIRTIAYKFKIAKQYGDRKIKIR